jgi:hypothetical protein
MAVNDAPVKPLATNLVRLTQRLERSEPYEGVGFRGLEEIIEIWGPENPCLIMLAPASGASP